MTTQNPTPANAAYYANLLQQLDNSIATLSKQRDELLEEIRQQYQPTGETLDGGLTVSPGVSRLNEKRIAELYPVAEHPELYSIAPKIDAKKVRAHLSQVELQRHELLIVGQPRVSVKQVKSDA